MMNGQFNNAYDDTNDGGTKTQDDRIDLQTFSSQYGATNQSIKEKDDEQEKPKMGNPSGVSSVMRHALPCRYVYWEILSSPSPKP